MVSNSAGLDVWGSTVVISTPPLFGIAFSLSPSLYAVCDVGFGNNKWLDVFRCHVKPGEGHVLSEHTTTAGGGGFRLQGLGLGCTQSTLRHQTPAGWALCQVSVTGERELHLKQFFFFFFNWP